MRESVFDRERRIRAGKLTMGQTFLLVTLNQAIGTNSDAWPSQAFIAGQMNAGLRSVRKWTRELQAAGILQIQPGRGRSLTNRYRLNLDALEEKAASRAAFTEEKAASRAAFTEEKAAPRTAFTDEKAAPGAGEKRHDVPVNAAPRAARKNNKEKVKEHQAVLPGELQKSAEFRDAWREWIAYRKEIRKALTQTTAERQLRRLAAWGPSKAVHAIQSSLEHGWTGLFDPDPKRNGHSVTGSAEAVAAFQSVLEALKTHGRFEPQKVMAAVSDRAWQALRPIGLKRLDEANDFERRQLQAEFCQSYNQQGAAA